MKKRIFLWGFVCLLLCTACFALPVSADAPDAIPDTSVVLAEAEIATASTPAITPADDFVKIGEQQQYTCTGATGSVTWMIRDTNIATVSSTGLVTGVSQGQTYLSAHVDGVYVTVTIKVGALEEGTYFIGNKGSGKYMEVESASSVDGAPIQQYFFHGMSWGRWIITMESYGNYSIRNVYTNKYIGVENSSTAGGTAIKQYSSVANQKGRQWSITVTASGAYRFTPCSSTAMALAVPITGTFDDGTNLVQLTYTENTNYRDEWVVERLLPTSGYELEYSPSLWDEYANDCCNCYAYAINNQVYPGTNYLWFKQQMGEYFGNQYSMLTESNIRAAVINDFRHYNSRHSESLVFEPVGRYDVCPPGTYKIALVASNDDYHWYRQDSDGLWSHKPGTTPVTRLDASNKYIVDPYIADRGLYTQFLGYYAVSPWNNTLEASTPVYCYIQGYIVLYDDLMTAVRQYYAVNANITNMELLSMMSTHLANIGGIVYAQN